MISRIFLFFLSLWSRSFFQYINHRGSSLRIIWSVLTFAVFSTLILFCDFTLVSFWNWTEWWIANSCNISNCICFLEWFIWAFSPNWCNWQQKLMCLKGQKRNMKKKSKYIKKSPRKYKKTSKNPKKKHEKSELSQFDLITHVLQWLKYGMTFKLLSLNSKWNKIIFRVQNDFSGCCSFDDTIETAELLFFLYLI